MIIYLDHKNLTYFRNAQKLNHRQAWWSLLLSEYDIKIIHLPGDKMILSDTLSWRPDFIPDKDTDNEDIVLLLDRLFQETSLPDVWTTLRNPPISVNLIDLNLQRKIANSKDLDTEAIEAIDTLLNKGPTHLQRDLKDWTTEEFEGKNVLFFQGRTIFPKIMSFDKKSPPNSMTRSPLDTREKSKLSMPSKNIIGGLECKHSSRTMLKDVEFANHSR